MDREAEPAKLPVGRLGILSDTHLPKGSYALPAFLLQAFQGVDAILHGGDVVRLEALAPLMEIAPVYVVGGNNDEEEVGQRCGYRRALRWRGWRIGLVHGDTGRGRTTAERAVSLFRQTPPRYEDVPTSKHPLGPRAASRVAVPDGRPEGAQVRTPATGPFDAIVFGHSHIPCCTVQNGVLLLNPGSPTERRREPRASFALLDAAADGLHAHMLYL